MIKRTPTEDKVYKQMMAHKDRQKAWAIRAYCYQCAAYSFDEVRKCPCTDCPLYKFRLGPNHAAEK